MLFIWSIVYVCLWFLCLRTHGPATNRPCRVNTSVEWLSIDKRVCNILADILVFYHSPQALTSRKWTPKAQKLYLARYTHPLTLWHSHSAMCEYNVCIPFQHHKIYCYFLVWRPRKVGWLAQSLKPWVNLFALCVSVFPIVVIVFVLYSNCIFDIYLHLHIYHSEFLTSLWEMWTAAQGWGSPRPEEAGWDTSFWAGNFFTVVVFKALFNHGSFQKGALKAAILPRLHLNWVLAVLNLGVENPAASDV